MSLPTPPPDNQPASTEAVRTPQLGPSCGLCNGPMVPIAIANVEPPKTEMGCPRCGTTASNPLGARYQEPLHRGPIDQYGDEPLRK